MKNKILLLIILLSFIEIVLAKQHGFEKFYKNMKLVWSDEFNREGNPDTARWNFEKGFVRNEEFQWYNDKNVRCEKGILIFEARKETIENPWYQADSQSWKRNRQYAEYTSSSINSRNKFRFQYGILEVKARIDISMGLWPAIWTLGESREWPSCGEVDLMESYPTNGVHYLLANAAWGTNRRFSAKWKSMKVPLENFLKGDSRWAEKFHVWRMIWDEDFIKLYLDDQLLNEINLKETMNPDGFNPFHQPHYILLNLAVGGQNGGDPSKTVFPKKYEVDYVRIYQHK